jgi:hypothetical protein
MTVDLSKLLLLGLLCASTHWLVARSEIAKPLWSRARGFLSRLLRCPACSGCWLGFGYVAVGLRPLGNGFIAGFATVVLAAILTPVFEGVMLWGLRESAIEEDEDVQPRQAVLRQADGPSSEDAITPLDRPR